MLRWSLDTWFVKSLGVWYCRFVIPMKWEFRPVFQISKPAIITIMLINRFPLALRVRISLSSLRALPAVKNQIHGRIAQTRVQSTYIPHKNFCTNAFPKSVVLQNPADSENNQSDVMGKMYIEFTCKVCSVFLCSMVLNRNAVIDRKSTSPSMHICMG